MELKSRISLSLPIINTIFLVNTLDGGFFGFAMGFCILFDHCHPICGQIQQLGDSHWFDPRHSQHGMATSPTPHSPTHLTNAQGETLRYVDDHSGKITLLGSWDPGTPGTIHPSLAGTAHYIYSPGLAGLGAGMTANAWQILIGKGHPRKSRGTFFGTQSAAANLLVSVGAIAAGYILERTLPTLVSPCVFSSPVCSLLFSWIFLNKTKEPEYVPHEDSLDRNKFWLSVKDISKMTSHSWGF